jgi:hypothetical protein
MRASSLSHRDEVARERRRGDRPGRDTQGSALMPEYQRLAAPEVEPCAAHYVVICLSRLTLFGSQRNTQS